LMHIVQSRKPRFLKRQATIPKFIHHPPTGGEIEAVEAYRQFSVQMFHEIAMRSHRVLETHHQMIVIREEGPRLQNEHVVLRSSKVVLRKRVSFALESNSGFRCHVAAVMM
jgi:hypothetical protein